MKIADFKRIITPQIGCKLAGYDLNDVSNSIADDLYMTGLCVDDEKRKVLIISFDLLGLDGLYIQKMRLFRLISVLSAERSLPDWYNIEMHSLQFLSFLPGT